mgnify:CR=1 FL=1
MLRKTRMFCRHSYYYSLRNNNLVLLNYYLSQILQGTCRSSFSECFFTRCRCFVRFFCFIVLFAAKSTFCTISDFATLYLFTTVGLRCAFSFTERLGHNILYIYILFFTFTITGICPFYPFLSSKNSFAFISSITLAT